MNLITQTTQNHSILNRQDSNMDKATIRIKCDQILVDDIPIVYQHHNRPHTFNDVAKSDEKISNIKSPFRAQNLVKSFVHSNSKASILDIALYLQTVCDVINAKIDQVSLFSTMWRASDVVYIGINDGPVLNKCLKAIHGIGCVTIPYVHWESNKEYEITLDYEDFERVKRDGNVWKLEDPTGRPVTIKMFKLTSVVTE